MAIENPRHSPAHLLGVGVGSPAPDTREKPPIAVLLGPDQACPLRGAHVGERLPGPLPEGLLEFRGVYLFQSNPSTTRTTGASKVLT